MLQNYYDYQYENGKWKSISSPLKDVAPDHIPFNLWHRLTCLGLDCAVEACPTHVPLSSFAFRCVFSMGSEATKKQHRVWFRDLPELLYFLKEFQAKQEISFLDDVMMHISTVLSGNEEIRVAARVRDAD